MKNTDDISVYAADLLLTQQLLDENPEPHICRFFGCGKELKPAERLAGDYCTSHMTRINPDPTNVISY